MCNYNSLILMIVSLPFTINVTNLTIPLFIPWFRILSQYGASIVLLLGFNKAMQYPRKLQGECKHPNMMLVLHLHSITCSNGPSNINVKNFIIPHFLQSICMASYSEYGISISKTLFCFMVYDIITKWCRHCLLCRFC
jgi:hypothetical protein